MKRERIEAILAMVSGRQSHPGVALSDDEAEALCRMALASLQYVPEGTAADALKNQGRIVRNSIIEECAKVCVSAFASSNASERDDIWLEAASAIRALKHSLISAEGRT